MKTIWTSGTVDIDEKSQLETSLIRSKWVFEKLKTILDKMEQDLDRGELNTNRYDSPNWDFRQADLNGYRRCLRDVRDLINLDQKETNG